MSDSAVVPDYRAIRSVILTWLERRIEEEALEWLKETGEALRQAPEDWELFTSFSRVPRYTDKQPAGFSEAELRQAREVRKDWNPENWTTDQLARTYLMLCYADQGEEAFLDKIEKTFVTSDLGESVALYQALPLYPRPEKFRKRAAEGVRSNITTVFNAVALENPYPKEYMDEGAWNQIVLKALFVGSPLYRIQGIDDRANETLANMLVEYAHERWSAGRSVSPELWRPVGPFLSEEYEADIQKVLDHPDWIQKQAVVLALQNSRYPGKEKLLGNYQSLANEIDQKEITWDSIGRQYEATGNQ